MMNAEQISIQKKLEEIINFSFINEDKKKDLFATVFSPFKFVYYHFLLMVLEVFHLV